MLLQFCDKCGKPLSEGAIARGEAIERDGETICAHCQSKETVRKPDAVETGPLGEYHAAVWHCEGCGIPVTALDLIEGRASRVGGVLSCSRCASVRAQKGSDPVFVSQDSRQSAAALRKQGLTPSARPSLPRAPIAKPTPARAATEFVAEASKDQRKPVLPVVLFVIVLPMFAVSLWFAISAQSKLSEMAAQRNTEPERRRPLPDEPEPRRDPTPRIDNTSVEKPDKPQPEQPTPPDAGPSPVPLPPDVQADLLGIERDLAAPVLAKLRSSDPGEVWQGLIEAGSKRLIAARSQVRALLASRDDDIRAVACRVCAVLDDREALVELARIAEQDPNEAVKIEARKARDRMAGISTRETKDMTDAELEELIRELQEELKRRRGRND